MLYLTVLNRRKQKTVWKCVFPPAPGCHLFSNDNPWLGFGGEIRYRLLFTYIEARGFARVANLPNKDKREQVGRARSSCITSMIIRIVSILTSVRFCLLIVSSHGPLPLASLYSSYSSQNLRLDFTRISWPVGTRKNPILVPSLSCKYIS